MTLQVAFRFSSLLLSATAFTGLLLMGQLPPVLSALGVGALALSAARAAGWMPDWGPLRWSRQIWNRLLLAACAALVVDLVWISRDLLTAGVHLLVVLMVSKLLTLRERADCTHLHAISFLQLLACAALTVELWYGAVFVLYLLAAVWTLLLFHLTGEAGWREPEEGGDGAATQAAEAGRRGPVRSPLTQEFFWATNGLAAGALALTLAIFFVTPRVGAGFFEKRRVDAIRTTGFSGTVDLGEIGSVKQDETIVMRVILPDHQVPVEERLYFRGSAFDVYNGRAWINSLNPRHLLERSASGAFLAPAARLQVPDGPHRGQPLGLPGLRQEILMEVLDTTVLFAAPFVDTVEGGFLALQGDGMGSLHLPYPASVRFQYRAFSIPDRIAEEDRTAAVLAYPRSIADRFLQRPPMSPRVAELAAEVSGQAKTVLGKVRAVERFLRVTYRYTLDTGTEVSARPLEDFLFVRKSGYCEHYATAMVLMLRTLGIPARLVTGFLSGEWNDFGRYYAVRQRDAHAWVEVYFPRSGWVTFDPTPSVGAAPAGPFAALVGRWVDSLRLKWDRFVVQYSFRDQAMIAHGLRERGEQATGRLSAWLADQVRTAAQAWREAVRWRPASGRMPWVALGVGLAVLGLFVAWRRRALSRAGRRATSEAPEQTPLVRLYVRMLRLLEGRGLRKPPGATPLEFARAVRRQWAAAGAFVEPLTELYCRARFGRAAISPEELARAEALLAGLRAARRRP
ncbi:transglutaminase TgpA family protein [Nitrospira sp. Kam-Ns4a]